MSTLWFAIATMVVAIYVVLDGFDFGVGVLHLWIAKDNRERQSVFEAIGWYVHANEVWLVILGGTLFLAFPRVLASALSGFYLALMILLWLLILRGIALEFRSHLDDRMWRAFWDAVFAGSSALAAVMLGTAFANLVRGVPLQADGWFSLSLFESFSPRGRLGLLDWYTALGGVLAMVAMAHHGALFLAWRATGPVRQRAVIAATRLFPVTALLWLGATMATVTIAPFSSAIATRPVVLLVTAAAMTGLAIAWWGRRAGRLSLAFAGSSAFMAGIVAATGAALYPAMINSAENHARSLTVFNAAAGPDSLRAGLWWWPIGFVLAVVYLVTVFRLHRRRVNVTR